MTTGVLLCTTSKLSDEPKVTLEIGIRESSSTQETNTQVLTIRLLLLSFLKSQATMIPEINISKGQKPSLTHIQFQSDLEVGSMQKFYGRSNCFLYKPSYG